MDVKIHTYKAQSGSKGVNKTHEVNYDKTFSTNV